MADDKNREPGSITKTADAQNERISGISNVSRTINQMQKTTQQKIEETEESINYGSPSNESMREMNGVISRFGKTITSFTRGIENVTASTAKATSDAISQYSRAIGQDINYNKQNIVAMALSRTTPLFGYFAAKFMETDVYKKAKERMSNSIADTFRGIGSSISNIFKGNKEAKEKVPKMQTGGYVEKGGMVEVHPAEVVVPIEKILARIDESISVGKEIAEISRRAQMHSLAKMSTFVATKRDKEPVGMVKGFFRALREVQTQYNDPANARMLRAVLSIQDTLGAQVGTWQQVWTKMLIEHPFFRQIAFSLRTIGSVIGIVPKAVYAIFKQRGGYRGQLSKAKNPFERLNYNVGILYTGAMHRLDNITLYTKASAVILRDLATGISGGKLKYPNLDAISDGSRSIFGWHMLGLNKIFKYAPRLLGGILGGKKGWQVGTKIGDFAGDLKLSTLRRKLQFERAKKLDFALGGGNFFKSDESIGSIVRNASKKKVNKKDGPEIKLLTYIKKNTKASSDELNKHNDRERRRGALGFLSGIGSFLLKMLMTGGGFLKSLFGFGATGLLGGLVGGLFKPGGILSKGVMSIFGAGGLIARSIGWFGGWLGTTVKTIFRAGGVVARSLMGAASSMGVTLGTALFGAVSAAIAGLAIGTLINKYIIEPIRDSLWKTWDKKNAEASKRVNKDAYDSIQKARGETAFGKESYLNKVKNKALGSLAIGARQKSIGTDSSFAEIQEGQMSVVSKNLAEYAKYDPDLLKVYRKQWLESEGRIVGRRAFFSDPIKYGARRETMFLAWLKRKGNIVSMNKMMVKHQGEIFKSQAKATYDKYVPATKKWLAEKGKYALDSSYQLVEKASGKIVETKDIAKMKAHELLTAGKLISQELKSRGMDQMKGMENLGDRLQQNLSNISTVINNQTSQVTRVFNSGKSQSGMIDEINQRIVTGNFH